MNLNGNIINSRRQRRKTGKQSSPARPRFIGSRDSKWYLLISSFSSSSLSRTRNYHLKNISASRETLYALRVGLFVLHCSPLAHAQLSLRKQKGIKCQERQFYAPFKYSLSLFLSKRRSNKRWLISAVLLLSYAEHESGQ
jgi:hypothetical protein